MLNYDFFLNLGGIANISSKVEEKMVAFDVGGANQILNALAELLGMEFDEDGKEAAKGQLIADLFEEMNQLPYFSKPYPKSLSNQWVQQHQVFSVLSWEASVNDRLHTACQQMAYQIALSINNIIQKENLSQDNFRLLATGGGALNPFLMNCIQEQCKKIANIEVVLPSPDVIQFKEALLMALMGLMRIENIPI